MKFFFLSFLLLPSVIMASAQVPGYMGKRVVIFYEPNFFISIQSADEGGKSVGINLRNDIAADYTVSKSVALGASVKVISTGINNAFIYDDNNQKAFDGDIKLSGPAFGLYVKKFPFAKRGYLAPVGVYTRCELVYARVIGKTERLHPNTETQYHLVNDIQKLVPGKQSLFGIIFSVGRQNLFLDRLFINAGASVGLFPSGLRYFTENGYDHYYSSHDYYKIVDSRISGYFMFNFNIGIGLLAL